jgi:3-hydroxybutyryl-CoA dehydrogenase
MKPTPPVTCPILLIGNGNPVYSISVCLLKAKYKVVLHTENTSEARSSILQDLNDINNANGKNVLHEGRLKIKNSILKEYIDFKLAIVINEEELQKKREIVSQLESTLSGNAIIAINTESISLSEIQKDALHPERIIGLNWTEPAYTTQFLEIITGTIVSKDVLNQINKYAKTWNKDPYTVQNFSVRSKLISAMIREAFYLVDNGYASIEDIDRACRNDAGYYLPFAGNCRYMDLMGTYAYGRVMKDLNPDLSKEQELPKFFTDILQEGGLGMQNGKGLYNYEPNEVKEWRKTFNEFSFKIEEIINKYPFSNMEDKASS